MNLTDEFTRKAKVKHGDTYDYSKAIYNDAHNKLIIVCKGHGEFQQSPSNHVSRGAGCPKCANDLNSKRQCSSTNEFIAKAIQLHGDTFQYKKTDYAGNNINVIITCKMHGDFEQTPHSHLSGSGCRQCGLITTANKRRKGYTDFIEQSRQVHGDMNDYSKVEYNSTNKKVIISCKMHGDFEQTPGSHLQGSGCPTCGIINNGNKRRNTADDFIEKAQQVHGDTYEYSQVRYINSQTIVVITCEVHGNFELTS